MPQPQDSAAGSADEQPRLPWARRSAAALGWALGFALAIGLVVAAIMIPVAFTVNTASQDQEDTSTTAAAAGGAGAAAGAEETELPDESMQPVTLEVTSSEGGEVEWEIDGTIESEQFQDSWTKEIEVPSGSWPRLVVTGDTEADDLELTCAIKLDGEPVIEKRGTDSTQTATCSVFV
ncbi:hypothetical protein [Kocuria palustris]|uniref:hypothetical protein n=1 Tax=Kocuria palustris TaxID=71999 RepID=UPI0011A9D217|nr:hypothetical protein [Kocuria palustris]